MGEGEGRRDCHSLHGDSWAAGTVALESADMVGGGSPGSVFSRLGEVEAIPLSLTFLTGQQGGRLLLRAWWPVVSHEVQQNCPGCWVRPGPGVPPTQGPHAFSDCALRLHFSTLSWIDIINWY